MAISFTRKGKNFPRILSCYVFFLQTCFRKHGFSASRGKVVGQVEIGNDIGSANKYCLLYSAATFFMGRWLWFSPPALLWWRWGNNLKPPAIKFASEREVSLALHHSFPPLKYLGCHSLLSLSISPSFAFCEDASLHYLKMVMWLTLQHYTFLVYLYKILR